MKHFDSTPCIIMALNFVDEYDVSEFDYLASQFGVDPKEVEGRFNGELETSWVIDVHNYTPQIELAKQLARKYDQGGFLYLDNQRNAYMFTRADDDYEREYAGKFVAVNPNLALQLNEYTHDPKTGNYWVIR